MKLNTAQKLTAAWLGLDLDFFSHETVKVATEQTRSMGARYRAPHANWPTPPKRHYSRATRAARLFKGHRP